MISFLDCWIASATPLFAQALAGEPNLVESQPKPIDDYAFGGKAFGFAATLTGALQGRFTVILDPGILDTPLMGEGTDQRSSWGELLREVADAASGDLLARTGQACRVERFEETGQIDQISRAFQLQCAASSFMILVRDELVRDEVVRDEMKAPAAEKAAPPSAPPPVAAVSFAAPVSPGIELLLDVELEATLRFGCRELPLGEILELGPGDVVQLDRHITEPADLIVGDKIVARGEVVLINGNFGLRITEVAAPRKRLESIRCLF